MSFAFSIEENMELNNKGFGKNELVGGDSSFPPFPCSASRREKHYNFKPSIQAAIKR
jgi:hypothetical protein